MTDDEKAIHNLVEQWMNATKTGDINTVLEFMTDDVVFLVAGQEPFGKEVFQSAIQETRKDGSKIQYEGESSIEELKILGEWAFARTKLKVTTIPSDENARITRSGYTLTIFKKESDGKWRLARDANLLTVDE